MKNKELMYKTLAKYYDLVYSWKDYKSESEKIHDLIDKHLITHGNELLEVACGTGNYLQFLKDHFKTTGLDLNKEMLAVAKKKMKGVKLTQGDMRSFSLKKQFDVVLCLFSSIGYLKSYEELGKTMANFSKHMKRGGVIIIEPFVSKKKFHNNHIRTLNVQDKNTQITRMNHAYIKGDVGVLDFHFFIGTKKGVEYVHDPHEAFLFDEKKFLRIMKQSGLAAEYHENGLMENRGLYIGTKK